MEMKSSIPNESTDFWISFLNKTSLMMETSSNMPWKQKLSVVMMSVIMMSVIMMSVIMMSGIMMSGIMMSGIMMSAMAPKWHDNDT